MVMCGGEVTGELERADFSQEKLLTLAIRSAAHEHAAVSLGNPSPTASTSTGCSSSSSPSCSSSPSSTTTSSAAPTRSNLLRQTASTGHRGGRAGIRARVRRHRHIHGLDDLPLLGDRHDAGQQGHGCRRGVCRGACLRDARRDHQRLLRVGPEDRPPHRDPRHPVYRARRGPRPHRHPVAVLLQQGRRRRGLHPHRRGGPRRGARHGDHAVARADWS